MSPRKSASSSVDIELLQYRINKLEQSYALLDEKIDKIMTNHLPHIEKAVQSLDTKINSFTAINVAAVIIGIIVNNLLK